MTVYKLVVYQSVLLQRKYSLKVLSGGGIVSVTFLVQALVVAMAMVLAVYGHSMDSAFYGLNLNCRDLATSLLSVQVATLYIY